MKRDYHAVILLLVGGVLIRTSVDGGYASYVRVGMRPFLIATGVVLVAVALASLVDGRIRRRGAARPASTAPVEGPHRTGEAGHEDDHGHDHGHGFDPAWLLAVPLLALLILAPPALGSYSAGRSGTALGTAPAAGSDFPALPDGDPVRLSVLDFANRAVFDQGRSLGQRRVTLTGFVLPGSRDRVYLARMVVACCAADARPIKVGLTGKVPAELGPDAWVEVTGRYADRTDTDEVNAEPIPYLDVEAVVPVPEPKRPYES